MAKKAAKKREREEEELKSSVDEERVAEDEEGAPPPPDAHVEEADSHELAEEQEAEERAEEHAAEMHRVEEEPDNLFAALRGWADGKPLSRAASLLFGFAMPAIVLVANMWRVRSFTIDDAYISYRYARNFANGLGLVYNPGERIEGYTNFLLTVLLGVGVKLGIDPDVSAKVIGALSALGALYVAHSLAGKLRPYTTTPCVANWLFVSSIVFSGYAVFGLETSLFVFMILSGTWLFFDEEAVFEGTEKPRYLPWTKIAIPYSAVVFGLAELVRPEAPAFIGILALFLGAKLFSKRNFVRGGICVAIVAAHYLWRHAYYGEWLANPGKAKTGNWSGQIPAGWNYVQNYLQHAGPFLWFALLGIAIGLVSFRRNLLALTALTVFVAAYVTVVGGDWMPLFRFMAPFEAFCFLLVDVGVRTITDRRDRAGSLAVAGFAAVMFYNRADNLRTAQRQFLEKEKHFWTSAAGGTAAWFQKNNAKPGSIAIGDIGEVGYRTNFPILDLLGLVDPVIPTLPGGYTQKIGPGFRDYFFKRMPEYALIISANIDCQHPSVPGSQVLYRDPRFLPAYEVAGKVPLDGGFAWCIYRRKDFK